jgi:hypothetical protein
MTCCRGVHCWNRWTGIIPAVFFVSFCSASARSMFRVSSSMSTRTGFPPKRTTQEVEAKKVKVGVSTSAPSLNPRISEARTSASEPDARPTAYFAPSQAAASFSNSATSLPRIKSPRSMTPLTAASNSKLRVLYSRTEL